MIDLHAHILPNIDDGARTVEDARMIARKAALDGVTAIAATPHVRADYPTLPEQMEAGVEALRADFVEQYVPVEVLHGGEIALDVLWEIQPEDLLRFTIAQSGRYLLLEFPYRGSGQALAAAVRTLRGSGIRPILGHPERNPTVQDRPAALEPLVDAGALVQITAGSLDPELGKAAERAARTLIERGLVHMIGSDVHGPHIPRDTGLAAAAELVRDPALAHYLTYEAPAAVAAGEPVPLGPLVRGRLA
jgi:protein-tyrosine phosphatase